MKIGDVLIKEFFIVAFVPEQPGGNKGFFICGGSGVSNSPFGSDQIEPCITTDRHAANSMFERAQKTFQATPVNGSLVLIRLAPGLIEQIDTVTTNQQEVTIRA